MTTMTKKNQCRSEAQLQQQLLQLRIELAFNTDAHGDLVDLRGWLSSRQLLQMFLYIFIESLQQKQLVSNTSSHPGRDRNTERSAA